MPLKVQTRNAKQECYLFRHAQLLLLGSKEASLDIPELPNHVKAKIGRGGRPMVLLCSKWCGPTWQSGEWISLVAPNSHRWRRKKKITTVRPGCYCHAMSEHIGCSISNLECRLDLLVEALGNHDVNGIGLQSGSQTKTLM